MPIDQKHAGNVEMIAKQKTSVDQWSNRALASIGSLLVVLGAIQILDSGDESSILIRGWTTVLMGASMLVLFFSHRATTT